MVAIEIGRREKVYRAVSPKSIPLTVTTDDSRVRVSAKLENESPSPIMADVRQPSLLPGGFRAMTTPLLHYYQR